MISLLMGRINIQTFCLFSLYGLSLLCLYTLHRYYSLYELYVCVSVSFSSFTFWFCCCCLFFFGSFQQMLTRINTRKKKKKKSFHFSSVSDGKRQIQRIPFRWFPFHLAFLSIQCSSTFLRSVRLT